MLVVLGFKGCWTSGLNYSLLLCSKWEFTNKAIFWGEGQQVDPPNSKISWLHARLRMDQHLISNTNIHLTFLKCHRSYCMEIRSHQTTLAVGSDRHMHAATRPHFSTVLFSRPPFWMLMLSVFLPLSVSLALPVFRGTWRGIRQGSETDCHSSVHFSAASSEPGSRRWPSWALRSWASLHRCICQPCSEALWEGRSRTWGWGRNLELKCRLEEDNSFLWISGILEVTILSNALKAVVQATGNSNAVACSCPWFHLWVSSSSFSWSVDDFVL